MQPDELEAAARIAAKASDLARAEILPRFRKVSVETKSDGSPVTEADRAAERVIRTVLREAYPEFDVIGEELDDEVAADGRPTWVVDPIDGTISFARGIPCFGTLIALIEDGETTVGVLDLPALDERYIGWKGGGCWLGNKPVHASTETDLSNALVSLGDPLFFELGGMRSTYDTVRDVCPRTRAYTDAFGHAMVLGGGVDAMVDMYLNVWDLAPTRLLAREAGGGYFELKLPGGSLGCVFGSEPLVEQLVKLLGLENVAGGGA
jgi:histidinol-phosphatase